MRYALLAAAVLAVLAVGFQGAPARATEAPRVTIFVADSVTFVRGAMGSLVVAIDRSEYLQPVSITVAGLPGGVTPEQNPMSVRNQPAVFIFNITPTAAVVSDLPVLLIAVGHDGAVATRTIHLTVRD